MMFKGEIIRHKLWGSLFLSGIVLVLFFNNCGRFMDRPYGASSASSFNDENYPWPNESTTLATSNQLASKVAFGDFDQNTFEDAAFVSQNPKGDQIMIRIVRSGNFTEQFNLTALPASPDPRTRMLFVDLDSNGGDKELVYLSADRRQIVCLDLSGTPGTERCPNSFVVEPIDMDADIDFSISRLATGNAIEIAGNLLSYGRGQTLRMESGLLKVNGAWGEWGDWFLYNNGTSCSKVCGDGIEIRNRACNNPAPRNGGDECPMETVGTACNTPNVNVNGATCSTDTIVDTLATSSNVIGAVHTKLCRLRDCDPSECPDGTIFNNGSCDRDPNATDPYTGIGGTGGTGGGGSGGGSGGGGSGGGGSGGGIVQPSDCTAGQVYDPYFFRCFKAYSHNNIFLTYRERDYSSDDGVTYINRTYRIGLNHRLMGSMSYQMIAREYCRFQGHFDVVSWTTGSYTAGSGGDQEAYILCNQAVNGRYQRCPVRGQQYVRWDYQGVSYNSGSQFVYLKSVICRKQDN